MKKKYLTSLIMLGTATLGMVGLVVASQKDGSQLLAADTSKTFTINSSTHTSASNFVSDGYYVNLEYVQTIAKYPNSGMRISGYYIDKNETTVDTNNASSYLAFTTPDAYRYNATTQIDFYVNGLTSVTYNLSFSDGINSESTIAASYVTFYKIDSDGNETAYETTEDSTSGTLTTVETGINVVRVYLFGYGSSAINSLTFNYNCQMA